MVVAAHGGVFGRPSVDEIDQHVARAVCASVPGYSGLGHYAFFKHVLATRKVRSILVLGVYFGRDIIFLCEAARRLGSPVTITGVDKFSDDACADWPDHLRGHSWEAAGFGPAPSLEAASENLARFGCETLVRLVREPDQLFLARCRERFDMVYLDTAHDYGTVVRQMRAAAPLLSEHGCLAGDDYSDQGTWGVRSAVRDLAPDHELHFDWIWLADRNAVLDRAELSPA